MMKVEKSLRILLYLACTATGLYQSVKSVMLFFSYPISTTYGEKPVTFDDFPYLLLCNRTNFWDPNGELVKHSKVRFDMVLFTNFLKADMRVMETFPWESVSLEDYYKTFTIKEPYLMTNKPKKIYESYYLQRYDNKTKLIYSILQGMCQYIKPWLYEEDVAPGSIEIPLPEVDNTVQSLQPNMNELKTIFFGLTNYKKTLVFSRSEIGYTYTVDFVKRTRLPINGYQCIDTDGYNQVKCWETCFLKGWYQHQDSTCQLPWITSYRNLPTCNNYQDFKQTVGVLKNRTFYLALAEECDKGCAEACTTVTYNVEPQIKSGDEEMHLHIKFEPKMQIIEESRSYLFINMFGDIGGIMGIFLGISVFGLYADGVEFLLKLKKKREASKDK